MVIPEKEGFDFLFTNQKIRKDFSLTTKQTMDMHEKEKRIFEWKMFCCDYVKCVGEGDKAGEDMGGRCWCIIGVKTRSQIIIVKITRGICISFRNAKKKADREKEGGRERDRV